MFLYFVGRCLSLANWFLQRVENDQLRSSIVAASLLRPCRNIAASFQLPLCLLLSEGDGSLALDYFTFSSSIADHLRSASLVISHAGKTVITSDHALKLESVPDWIAVVGSGYIGLEFSDVYTTLGSEITFVEALDQLMPGFDPEISKLAQRVLINPRNIDYHTGVFASKITPARDGKPVLIELIDAKTKEPKETLEVDAALIATGRAPFTQGLGLESVDVVTQRGFIPVDERMRVIDANGKLVPHLFCIGDANGKMMLAHAASAQGISVIEQVSGRDHVLNHLSIPAACFTHPEISMVGLTEPQAREKGEKEGFEVSVAKTSFKANTKALAENEGEGLAKLIYRPDNGEILGVHIFGLHAADLIHEASNAIALGTRIQEIKLAVHAHPTLSEVLDELFKSAKVKAQASIPISEPVAV